MDPATRLKRHAQLWSASETRVRRIGIGGAIFALIILLGVIEPYSIASGTREDLETQESGVRALSDELSKIRKVEEQLDNMARTIKEEPWTKQIQSLKDKFKARRITDPSRESQEILVEIASDLKDEIIAPLRAATNQLPDDNRLSKVPDTLDASVNKWLETFREVDWWRTVARKNETTREIGEKLTQILDSASANAQAATDEIKIKSETMRSKLENAKKIVETLNKQLQNVMDRALPAWARGMLKVEQLLVVYPWLLAGLAALLVATGWRGSRQFHAMADGEGWSAEERRDPLLSSSWTLTNRGPSGSIATFLTYGSVLGVLSACLYRHYYPPTTPDAGSLQVTATAIAEQSGIATTIAGAILVGAIAFVVAALFRHPPGSDSA